MDGFSTWSLWLIFGFGLLVLELIIPGIFVMWWGFSALVVAGILAVMPDLVFGWQATFFALLASLFSLLWWKVQHGKDKQEDQHTELNSREHAMLGLRGAVVEILDGGIARGKFGDTTWRIQGENLQVGQTVEVFAVEGITLKVKVVCA